MLALDRRVIDYETEGGNPPTYPALPFGTSVSVTFTCLHCRSLHKFTSVHHASCLVLTRLVTARRSLLSRFVSRMYILSPIVGSATLFMTLGSSSNIDGLLLLVSGDNPFLRPRVATHHVHHRCK